MVFTFFKSIALVLVGAFKTPEFFSPPPKDVKCDAHGETASETEFQALGFALGVLENLITGP